MVVLMCLAADLARTHTGYDPFIHTLGNEVGGD